MLSYHDINNVITKSKVKRGKTTFLDIISLDILTLLKQSDASMGAERAGGHHREASHNHL